MTQKQLQSLAKKHGTPLVIIDHDIIRKNYAEFRKHLPKVQCYFAVKANAEPAKHPNPWSDAQSWETIATFDPGSYNSRISASPLGLLMAITAALEGRVVHASSDHGVTWRSATPLEKISGVVRLKRRLTC